MALCVASLPYLLREVWPTQTPDVASLAQFIWFVECSDEPPCILGRRDSSPATAIGETVTEASSDGDTSPEHDPPSPSGVRRPADGLLRREDFTPERIEWYRRELMQRGAQVFLSPEEREQSRKEALAKHRAIDDLWVFGYGSLMWNPAIHVAESRVGRADRLVRRFSLSLSAGRGTTERPGLMLAVDEGDGHCWGVVHRIDAAHVESETSILWMREMLSGAYTPHWVDVACGDNCVRAITFVINRAHPRFEGNLDKAVIAQRIAFAEGFLGTNRDYLYRTMAELTRLGLDDPYIFDIFQLVKAIAPDDSWT